MSTISARKQLRTSGFKKLGPNTDKLLSVYLLKIRSLLEYAAPVFHSSLTIDQSNQLETMQKKALSIIYGNRYVDYNPLFILKEKNC